MHLCSPVTINICRTHPFIIPNPVVHTGFRNPGSEPICSLPHQNQGLEAACLTSPGVKPRTRRGTLD